MAKNPDETKQQSAMNKIPAGLTPNSRLFLAFLVIFAVATLLFSDRLWLAAAEGAIILVLVIYSLLMRRSQRKKLLAYVESVTYDTESAKNNTLQNFPLPVAVFRPADAQLIWANQHFFELCGIRRPSVEMRLTDVMPNFSSRWMLDGHSRCPDLVEHNGRKYQIHGNLVQPKEGQSTYMGITYWLDVTDYENTRQEYLDSRPCIALFVIDNYDEFFRGLTDRKRSEMRDTIEDLLIQWCDELHGFFRHYDRDRFLLVFEERYLEQMRNEKLNQLLEDVHSIANPVGIRATLSIGVGREGDDLEGNYNFAALGVEMAISRGGDQAVLKNRTTFEFFGGRGGEIETRSRVRARVMASALKELIADSSKVYVMGHKMSDLDAIGAAVGIRCIARKLDTPCRIVVDATRTASGNLIEKLSRDDAYRDCFISPQEAILRADSRTLLVVVDTNRPAQVEDQALLESCTRVALVDHHRRAAEYIENPTLSFHEPNASSSCELVAELMEEIVERDDVLRIEAEAVLSGIMLDTKNFNIRTGERTFEAAAFLRRTGADTAEVKKLMQSDLAHTVARCRILQNAHIYRPGIAIVTEQEPQDRIVAARAADELLNVAGVNCSVVIYPVSDGTFVSARSIGEMNVQLLLEPFGGGGNRAAAAAHCTGLTPDETAERIKAAIDAFKG